MQTKRYLESHQVNTSFSQILIEPSRNAFLTWDLEGLLRQLW